LSLKRKINTRRDIMKSLFKKSDKIDKRIYDLKQIEEHLDKVESIKRDYQSGYISFNCYSIK